MLMTLAVVITISKAMPVGDDAEVLREFRRFVGVDGRLEMRGGGATK